MPHTATPLVKPVDLRKGDILPSGATILDRPTIVQRGHKKGFAAIETGGGRLVIEPDIAIYVEREVATAEERDAYRAAYARFRALVETVQARTAFDRAVGELEQALNALKHDPLNSGGRSALRSEPGEVEFATGAYRAVWNQHGEILFEDGHTPASIAEMAVQGRMSTHLFKHAPRRLPNEDCYLDGTPAPKTYADNVAPAYAPLEG